MPEPRTITKQVEENWEHVRNSPETKEAFRKLSKETFGEHARQCRESLTTYLNFESYKNSLQILKTCQGSLHPETEAAFAERSEQAVAAYRSFVSSSAKIAKSFTESGLETVVTHNMKKLCWQLPHSKYYPNLADMLRTMGVTDPEIAHYAAVLQEKDWDLLHLQAANGTFADMVHLASEQLQTMEKMHAAVKQHGLPVIEGAGGSVYAFALGIVVVIGVTCLLSGACEFLL